MDVAVDIVITNHDYARFLPAAIDSALAQTHPHVHVIAVDDGSTDDSASILAGYRGRVDVVLKEHGGQASAFNAGFARSRGDAVVFLDADDVLLPGAAAAVAAAFRAQPGLAKVQYPLEVADAAGRPTGIRKPPPHLRLPAGDLRRHELAFPFDLTWMATSGNAFAAPVLRRILPMPEAEYLLGADWYVSHLTPLFGPVASLDRPEALYRVHGANGYEVSRPRLSLEHVRQSVRYAGLTARHLERCALELGVAPPRGGVLSVADVANRMVSLKLDPARHPVPGDRLARLVASGLLAAARRFDVAWPMRALFAVWFAAFAAAPRRIARPLAEVFLFPERRAAVNGLLGALHR